MAFDLHHGRMNHKDTKPYMSAFLSVDLLTEFAEFCLTDSIDWWYIHSWFVFSTQLVNCCPHGRRNYMVLVYCCPSTVPSLWPPPLYPPSQCTVQYTVQTVCDCGGGGVGGVGVEMYCGPYSVGVLHSVSDQIQNLQNCFTTPNKMTSEDDIKGLVSLKFLRPWISIYEHLGSMCTAVLRDPPHPHIWAHLRWELWLARIDDISLWPSGYCSCWRFRFRDRSWPFSAGNRQQNRDVYFVCLV